MDYRFPLAVAARKLVMLLVAAAAMLATAPVYAQDDSAEALKALRGRKSALRRDVGTGIWREGRFGTNDQRAKLQEYFGVSLQMMQVPAYQSEVAKERLTMVRELRTLGNAASRDAFNVVVQYLVSELPKIINEDKQAIHVRYNAMLLLGDLNAQEAPPTGLTPPTPLPQALSLLLAAYQNDQLPPALKAGALLGLQRHASLGIADKANTDALRAAMLKTYTAAQPPANVSPEAHNWIKIRAVEILGALGTTGTTPDSADVVAAILGVINDSNADILLRAESARALQSINFSVPANLNTPLIARSLAQLVTDALGDAPDRQRIKHVLHCARLGLTGPDPDPRGRTTTNPASVSKVGSPEAKQMMATLAKEFETLSKQIDDTADVSTVTGETLTAWLQQHPLENQRLTASN